MLLWAKQPFPSHPSTLRNENYFGIWTVFAFPSHTAFQYVRLLKRRLPAT